MKIPEGYHTITPYFTVSDADQLLEFLVEAFDGTIVVANRDPNGSIQHARIRIGDSIIMLNESNEQYPVNVSQMHLYVDDVEIVFSKALSAGAISIMEPNVRPHGDHMAGVKDPRGNIWWIARYAGK
jgi:PhnB protein